MDSTTPPQYIRNDSCQSRSDRSDDGLAAQKRRRIKSHRKSRGGCLMCKTRKVKVRNCDMIALQTRPYDPAVLRKEAAMRQLRQDGRRMCLRRGTG